MASRRAKREIGRRQVRKLSETGSFVLLRDVPDARREPLHAVEHRRSFEVEWKPTRDASTAKVGGRRSALQERVQLTSLQLELGRAKC
jgi:hypothetical protein